PAPLAARAPPPRALVGASGFVALPAELRAQVASELNVRTLDALSTVADDLVDHVVKPNFRALGRRFGSRTQAVAAAIISADPGGLAGQLREAGEASVAVDGEPLVIGPDDVIVTQTPRTGWSVAADAGETVALDLDITPELRREVVAREMIRLVQDARKADGLQVSDRIAVRWEAADPEIVTALTEHGQLIAGEVLATEFASRALGAGTAEAGPEHIDAGLDLIFWLRRARDRGARRGSAGGGRLVRLACLAGHQPGGLGFAAAGGLQVAVAEEADQDAPSPVVSGDPGYHRHLAVQGCGTVSAAVGRAIALTRCTGVALVCGPARGTGAGAAGLRCAFSLRRAAGRLARAIRGTGAFRAACCLPARRRFRRPGGLGTTRRFLRAESLIALDACPGPVSTRRRRPWARGRGGRGGGRSPRGCCRAPPLGGCGGLGHPPHRRRGGGPRRPGPGGGGGGCCPPPPPRRWPQALVCRPQPVPGPFRA